VLPCIQTLTEVFINVKLGLGDVFKLIDTVVNVFINATSSLADVF